MNDKSFLKLKLPGIHAFLLCVAIILLIPRHRLILAVGDEQPGNFLIPSQILDGDSHLQNAMTAPSLQIRDLRVGAYENPPKIYANGNGEVVGFWPDLIHSIADEEGWNIVWVHGTWEEGLERLRNNEIDMMPDVAWTEERNRLYAFSDEPVFNSWSSLYVPTGSDIATILDLEGKKIGVLAGSVNYTGPEGIRDITNQFNVHSTFVEFNSYTDAFQTLHEKTIDAAVTNKDFGNTNERLYDIDRTSIIFQPLNINFAFPKDAEWTPELIVTIDRHMRIFKADSDSVYYQALDQHLGEEPVTLIIENIPPWMKNLLAVSGGVIVFLIAVGTASTIMVRRQTREIQEGEARFRAVVEHMPVLIDAFDENGNIVLWNEECEKVTGFRAEEIIGNPEALNMLYIDRDYRERLLAKQADPKDGETPEKWNLKTKKGEVRTISWLTISNRINFPGWSTWEVGIDITDQLQVLQALQQREGILSAVAESAQLLLRNPDLENSIPLMMDQLGQATGVNRVYIFENHLEEDGTLLTSQRFEWVSTGIEPQIDNPILQNLPFIETGYERWIDLLGNNEAVFGNIEDFPDSEQMILAEQDILSIVVLPIFVRDHWWGFIGFDECTRIRNWERSEVDALKAAVGILGAVIQRNQAEEEAARQTANMGALYTLIQEINAGLDLKRIYALSHQAALRFMPGEVFVISILHEEEQEVEDVYLWDKDRLWDGSRYPVGQDLPDFIISTGRPLLVNEWDETYDRMTNAIDFGYQEEPIRSVLAVPLFRAGGTSFGMLSIQSYSAHAYTIEHEQLLVTLASQVSRAIENAQLYDKVQQELTERRRAEEKIRHQLQRLSALRTIDIAISSSFDLRLTLELILEQVVTLLKVDAADILLFNQTTLSLEYAAKHGFRSDEITNTSLKPGNELAGRAILQMAPLHIQDLSQDNGDPSRPYLVTTEDFVTYYGLPLTAKGQVKGVLEIFHRTSLKTDLDWLDFMDSLAWQAAIAIDNAQLFEDLQRSNLDLAIAYDATIEGWSRAMDLRDRETEGHTQRVTGMTVKMAQSMGIDDAKIVQIRRGALLHDIGKLGVPDHILFKPGKLTEEEWEIMRQHPTFAFEMLKSIDYLKPALDIPYCHHEKWDGSGYPRGLKGEKIPLPARIFAVVDVWDALLSDRPYRAGWPEEKVMAYIWEESGKHFDPQVVEVFMKMIETQA